MKITTVPSWQHTGFFAKSFSRSFCSWSCSRAPTPAHGVKGRIPVPSHQNYSYESVSFWNGLLTTYSCLRASAGEKYCLNERSHLAWTPSLRAVTVRSRPWAHEPPPRPRAGGLAAHQSSDFCAAEHLHGKGMHVGGPGTQHGDSSTATLLPGDARTRHCAATFVPVIQRLQRLPVHGGSHGVLVERGRVLEEAVRGVSSFHSLWAEHRMTVLSPAWVNAMSWRTSSFWDDLSLCCGKQKKQESQWGQSRELFQLYH